MRHLLTVLLRVLVIVTNILPFNAAVVSAASQSAETGSVEPIFDSAGRTPLPFVLPPEAIPQSVTDRFLPNREPLGNATGATEVERSPIGPPLEIFAPGTLGLSEPAILKTLAALPSAREADLPDTESLLPAWFIADATPSADVVPGVPEGVESLLPDWFAPAPAPKETVANSNIVLPDWFAGSKDPSALPPARPVQPPLAPQAAPLRLPVAEVLLQVDVTGPNRASVGVPATYGETYTAVIRNDSSETAYGLYLTATYPSFFVYDSDSSLITQTGAAIPFNLQTATGVMTFTPVSTVNLAPGQAITLTFDLRATCGAISGQRLEVGLYYDADESSGTAEELNTGAFNIPTGRGNLVIKKEPQMQYRTTYDYGDPITWVVTVQNTGLGDIYDAVVTDIGGRNLTLDTPLNETIPFLGIDESVSYVVTGTVSCDFDNAARAYWSCGNKEGDAYITNTVVSTAAVAFISFLPKVELEVTDPISFPYCSRTNRIVTINVDQAGGRPGNLHILSNIESDSFLELVPGTVSAGWTYNTGTGVFSYTGGPSVPDRLDYDEILSFQVRPINAYVCSPGLGQLNFTPEFQDICLAELMTGTTVNLNYTYAENAAPSLDIQKSGPASVRSGDVFTYEVTVTGERANLYADNVFVTDTLPSEFELVGDVQVTSGTANATIPGTLTWDFDAGNAAIFTATAVYTVRAITSTNGVCGASSLVQNQVQAVVEPSCVGCPPLTATDHADVAIQNNEGVAGQKSSNPSLEACDTDGFVITNRYDVSDTTTIIWTGAVFTEALGTNIGGGSLVSGTLPLSYTPGTLIVQVITAGGSMTYTDFVTPQISAGGQLVVDLTPLQAAGVATQGLTLFITYTLTVSDVSIANPPDEVFWDWSQLFLPGVSDAESCAGNSSFNNVVQLTIYRADLSVAIEPQSLDRCRTNIATINVTDHSPASVSTGVVVTFTASTGEINSILAHNIFTYTGGLAALGAPAVTSNPDIGGERGIITFTFPSGADIDADGAINFPVDVPCSGTSVWRSGVQFTSLCAIEYVNDATRDHSYRAPKLSMSVMPYQYTANEEVFSWQIVVRNTGNAIAENVVISNVLNQLQVLSYTTSATSGLTASDAISLQTTVAFTFAQLAPKEQQVITVYGKSTACDPVFVDLYLEHPCFGTSCSTDYDRVSFNFGTAYLRTSNAQTADLPACRVGYIAFTVKNASPDVTLYQLNITESLEYLSYAEGKPVTVTVTSPEGVVVYSTTSFLPVTRSVGLDEMELYWRAISATDHIFDEIDPLSVIRIDLPVKTSCIPKAQPRATPVASASGPCGNFLESGETANTVPSLKPDLTIVKEAGVAGGAYGAAAVANPGDTVVWRITVRNRPTEKSYVAENVTLSDSWDNTNTFSYTEHSSSLPVTATSIFTAPNEILWDVGDIQVDETIRFYITGTVEEAGASCAASTVNTATLNFGCDDGCVSAIVPQDSAKLIASPILSVSLPLEPIGTCGGLISVTVRNYGAVAYSTTLTVTVPANYVYSSTTSAPLTPTLIPAGGDNPAVYIWTPITIPAATAPNNPYVMNMAFTVRNQPTGTCSVPNGDLVTATISYNDHNSCTLTELFSRTVSANLSVLTTSLVVDKTPFRQVASVGSVISWTISLSNTGPGDATQNIMITDTVGSTFIDVTPSPGPDGTQPITGAGPGGTTVITWYLASTYTLPASGSVIWQAVVSATVQENGSNRNDVIVSANCDVGCRYAEVVTDTAFVSIIDDISKQSSILTGTVGDVITFTLNALLNDENAIYHSLIITDALPPGLGFVSATLVYTADADGGGSDTAPPITRAPAPLQTGNIVWDLGDTAGSVALDALITTIIRDDSTVQNGLSQLNVFTLSYEDDGGTGITGTFIVSDPASIDTVLPVMHIQKTYVTEHGCGATLFEDNFNDGFSGWTLEGGGGWSGPVNGIAAQTGNGTKYAFNGDTTLTDYSYSAMVRSTDTAGTLGLVFLAAEDTTSDFYRWQWVRTGTGTGAMSLVRPNGSTVPIASVPYEPNRWYHFEVRVEEDQARIYIDGQLVHTESSLVNTTGQIGLYAANQNGAQFEDVLVTRIQDSACYVGASDLVTYTITISSHESAPGYNLVISDNLPAELVFLTSTFGSSDPGTVLLTQPVSGTTGSQVWTFSQLTGTGTIPALTANQHTLVITVTARVTAGVPAASFFSSQVFLNYTSRITPEDLSAYGITTPTIRTLSGGSHSTGLRTIDGGLTKTVRFGGVPTATLGSVVTYNIVLPAPPITAALYNVTVTDQLKPGLALQTVTASHGGGAASVGNAFTVTYADIPAGAQRVITVSAIISSPAIAGNVITNVALMNYDGTITTSNQTTFTVTEPALTLDKGLDPGVPDPVGVGQLVTYTVRITNAGGATAGPAYDVVFTDTLPVGLRTATPVLLGVTLNSVPVPGGDYLSAYNPASGVLTVVFASAFSIPVSGVLALSYVAVVDSDVAGGRVLSNVAGGRYTSHPGTVPGERGYDIITDTVPVTTGLPLLTLEKSVQESVVNAGGYLTYTIAVTNSGIVSATGVVITDLMPAETHFITATLPHTGPAGGVVSWHLGTLDIGEAQTVTLIVSVTQPLPNGLIITNTAWVTSQSGITDSGSVTDVIASLHNLYLTKTVDISPVQAGDLLTYALDWSVSGTESAVNAIISDTLPANTVFVTGTLPNSEVGGVVRWPLGTVLPGQSGQVTATVRVTYPLANGTLLPNSAIIVDDGLITDSAEITTPVESSHQIQLEKTASPATVQAGNLLTYTLGFTVTGNEPLFDLTLTDTIPAYATFYTATPVAAIAPAVGGTGAVVWSLGNYLTATSAITQQTGLVTLVVSVAEPLTDGIRIVNTALLTDSGGLTDTATVTTPVSALHVLTLTKAASSDIVQGGDLLTYTLRYSIAGNGIAPNVTVSDTTPAGTTFRQADPAPASDPGQGNAGLVTWNLGTVSPFATGEITLVVRTGDRLLTGTILTNIATITDSDGFTDTASVTTTLHGAPQVVISKRTSAGGVLPWEVLTYTLVVTNIGTADAYNVTVSDTVPAEVTFGEAIPAQTGGPNPLSWLVGALGPGVSATLRYTATVNQVPPGTDIVNTAGVTHTGWLTEVTDTVTNTVLRPDIEIVKNVSVATSVHSATVVYTIDITNTGEVPFFPVRLTDTLPAGLDFVPGTFSPLSPTTISGQTLVWDNLVSQPLTPADHIQVQFDVRVTTPVTGTYINVVTATGEYPGGSITDTDQVPLDVRDPSIELDKQLAGQSVDDGVVTFTIRLTNTGPSPLAVIPLFDYYDGSYMTLTHATPPASLSAPGFIRWDNLVADFGGTPLAPNDSYQITTVFGVLRGITLTTNTAVVSDVVDLYDNIAPDDEADATIINTPTAVELLYFEGTPLSDGVRLRWATFVEVNNRGFHIWRSETGELADAVRITEDLIPGRGYGTGGGATYEYIDRRVTEGAVYTYWLVDIEFDDNSVDDKMPERDPITVRLDLLHKLYLPLVIKK